MDRLSGREMRSQWKNWEKGKDKELKRERERERDACLPGVNILGGLSKKVRASRRRLNKQQEYSETERVKASMLPPRKLKARQPAWQELQLCDAMMAEPSKTHATARCT